MRDRRVLIVFILRHHLLLEQLRKPMRISLRPEIIRVCLAHVRERRSVVLLCGGKLCDRKFEPSPRLRHCDLVVARIDLDQQFARFHTVVVLGMDADDSPVDPRAQRIDMSVYLRVIGGFVGLQIIPYEGRDRAERENQQHYQKHSFVDATEPRTSTRCAVLRPIPVAQFDPPIEILAGILAESLQPVARFPTLAQIFYVELSLRHFRIRDFAVRESPFGIFIDVAHFFLALSACIYKTRTKKMFRR